MTKEALDYVEREAAKNMEFHLKNIEALNKESHTTVTFLFVVISAAFSSCVKMFQTPGLEIWSWAMVILTIYLTAVAGYVVIWCLSAEDVYAPGNEPGNLMPSLEEHGLEEVRAAEFDNLQKRIDQNRERCEQTGKSINRARKAILFGLFVYPIAALLVLIARSSFGY